MKSAVLQKYWTDLVITETKVCALQATEIRVKTAYAGISFTDRIIQQGLYKYQHQHMPLPYTLGFEASGIVTEVGPAVSEITVGDKVVALQRSGCFSSEIVTAAENVIKLGSDVDLKLAASLPVNFFTAAHALQNIVKIFPRSNILVTSAAGGVGGILTQLGSQEHRVTGLVGSHSKKEYVQQLGASAVFTYKEFFDTDLLFDVVIVASGKDLDKYQTKLKKNGKMIVYGFHSLVPRGIEGVVSAVVNYFKLPTFKPFDLVYENKTVSGFNIIHLSPDSNEFRSLKNYFLELMNKNNLPSQHKISEYALEDINAALKDLAGGNTEGKIVIKF